MSKQRFLTLVFLISLATASGSGLAYTGAAAPAGAALSQVQEPGVLGKEEVKVVAPSTRPGPALPERLSTDDWAAILNHLQQTESGASLFTSQVAKLTASDAAAWDEFGYSVAIS